MEQYDLEQLRLIAHGGEADIYDIGDGKILRVLWRGHGKSLGKEKALQPILESHHINAPAVYEFLEVDGKPAEIMERISGSTMIVELRKHPFQMKKLIRALARMQVELSEIKIGEPFSTIRNTMDYFTSHSDLEKALINFANGLFRELPAGDQMCHGDFHPGNILLQDGKYFIIDWSGVYRSNFLADVANTYLLMKSIPRIPGQGYLQYLILKLTGSYAAKEYLREMHKLTAFDDVVFSKWTVVMAFLRTCYGLPSEIKGRIKYIRTCQKLSAGNADASKWFRKL